MIQIPVPATGPIRAILKSMFPHSVVPTGLRARKPDSLAHRQSSITPRGVDCVVFALLLSSVSVGKPQPPTIHLECQCVHAFRQLFRQFLDTKCFSAEGDDKTSSTNPLKTLFSKRQKIPREHYARWGWIIQPEIP